MLDKISGPLVRVNFSSERDSVNEALSQAVNKVENSPDLLQVDLALRRGSVDHFQGGVIKNGVQSDGEDVRISRSLQHYDLAGLKVIPNSPNTISTKATEKYNKDQIALIDRSALEKRQISYLNVSVVPDFVHDFFCQDSDTKSQAFMKFSEQFIGTNFHERLGGFITMPNKGYVPGKQEAYVEASTINEETKNCGGFALVSYWVPPSFYEGLSRFNEIFCFSTERHEEPPEKMSVGAYREKTGIHHLTTTLDIRKEYLPLLESLRFQVLSHLQSVYRVDLNEGGDKVDFYFHSPVYGDRTAGLHLHTRVNQGIHAGEFDTQRLGLDDVLSILRDENVENQQVKEKILDLTTKTESGKFFTMSPVWGADEFTRHDIGFELMPNPWKRPLSERG